MLVPYVRRIRYAVKKSFGLDYSDYDVMSSKIECVQKKYTPFALSIFFKEKYCHRHCYCVFGTFIYFRFWNKNHYDYYMIDIPSVHFSGSSIYFNDFID